MPSRLDEDVVGWGPSSEAVAAESALVAMVRFDKAAIILAVIIYFLPPMKTNSSLRTFERRLTTIVPEMKKRSISHSQLE